MKLPMEREYTILIATVSVWVASLSMILIPTIGLTTPVYPPSPFLGYQLVFLVVTACITAVYSGYLGVRHLFPERFKRRTGLD